MKTVYIYILDTLADWEIGHLISELNSKRFFKKDAENISIKMVSYSKEPITTMGGITIVPNCVIDEIIMDENTTLILPGAETWNESKHNLIIEKAKNLLSLGAVVCAICGATAALANFGILNKCNHTSNGKGYLEMVSPNYKGQDFYIDEPSVADDNLITASSTGYLLWIKQIINHLKVFGSNALEAWYNYFNTGEAKYFFELMQTL